MKRSRYVSKTNEGAKHLLYYSTTLLLFTVFLLVGCAGAKLVKEPEPITTLRPVLMSADEFLTASLYWVFVRNGPGIWVENADWDEYLIEVSNHSGIEIQLDKAIIVDSIGERMESEIKLNTLVTVSKRTADRYKDSHIKMESGYQPSTLYKSAAATGAAAGAAIAAATYSSTAYTAVAAAGTGVLMVIAAVPMLVGAGVYRGHANRKIDEKIHKRATKFPLDMPSGNTQSLDLFFPIAPSPRAIEIHYISNGNKHVLEIDTTESLQGLHLPPLNADR